MDFDKKREALAEIDENIVLFDGYEDAPVGYLERISMEPIAVYDRAKCIRILMKRDGMSREDAEEFFEFNSAGCWAGPHTPGFLVRFRGERSGR